MTDFDPIDASDPLAQLAGFDSTTAAASTDQATSEQWHELNAADLPQIGTTERKSSR